MKSLRLPPVDPPIATATVMRWRKQPGDSIRPGDTLVELEAEDSLICVEAEVAGQLVEIAAKTGMTLRAGEVLARVESVDLPDTASPTPTDNLECPVNEPAHSLAGKVVPVLMPQAGNTMEEGTVIAWRVKPGDQISAGQILCEIETDKATLDFESPEAGRLARIVASVGEPVVVKGLIALLADSDADADAYLAGQSSATSARVISEPSGTVATPADNDSLFSPPIASVKRFAAERVKASPAARRMAGERGLDLSSIGAGSGPGGRILTNDVARAAAASPALNGKEIRRPLSKMRRAIGLNLQQSKQTVPHFYVRTTIDADPLLAHYREQKLTANCTLNDVIILAAGRTMREFPAFRSQISGNEIVEYPSANIGIAVGVDDGLVVPVVTDVDTLSLSRLASETKRVVEAARKGRLENIGKGHFTISNLGMFGVEEFSAIINPPESGILAVSAAREAVIVENGMMRAGRNLTLTLSADHRLIDGVMAAKFMQRLREILEHPSETLA